MLEHIRQTTLRLCIRRLSLDFDWPDLLHAIADIGEEQSSVTVTTMARSAAIALSHDQAESSSQDGPLTTP